MGEDNPTSGSNRPNLASRASVRASLLLQAGRSFLRSKGERGASVETLRGNTGADFEGKAKVHRGGRSLGGIGCCCCGEKNGKDKFILVKGPFCFVFDNENSQSPTYAISLAHLIAEIQGEALVSLQTTLGDVDYELYFHDASTAQNFKNVVSIQAAAAEAGEIRKKLGHEHLLTKRSSLRYAETIAKKKVDDQPDAPISSEDVLAQVPTMNLPV